MLFKVLPMLVNQSVTYVGELDQHIATESTERGLSKNTLSYKYLMTILDWVG